MFGWIKQGVEELSVFCQKPGDKKFCRNVIPDYGDEMRALPESFAAPQRIVSLSKPNR